MRIKERRVFTGKCGGFLGRGGGFEVLWLKIGVLVEKSGVFQKMGFSWVFGQEIGEK